MAETSSSTRTAAPPHFVLVPFVEQGQTIPMVYLARRLAERGARVSLVTTPFNAARLQAQGVAAPDSAIDIVELPFPAGCDGVPSSCESFVAVLEALPLLAGPMEAYLRALERLPGCVVVADWMHPWVDGVARSVGVPRLFFHGPSCFYSLCDLKVATTRGHPEQEQLQDQDQVLVVPEMHVRVALTKATCSSVFLTGWPEWCKFREVATEAILRADGAVVNTFMDLEGQFVACYQEALRMPVWALGPLCLSTSTPMASSRCSGGDGEPSAVKVTAWLDTMDPGSVVYVSFGSITPQTAEQLYEVGHGLQDSGRPFLWVIKVSELAASSPQWSQWLRDLEARTAGRGLVLRGWAPQLAILAHTAVGGFLTHCGWNSMIEALAHGVPVITWPRLGDQFLNQQLAVDVLGVGVPVTSIPHKEVARGDVARAVSELMGAGPGADERRKKAKDYGERAHAAMDRGGSSYENLTRLLHSFSFTQQNNYVRRSSC